MSSMSVAAMSPSQPRAATRSLELREQFVELVLTQSSLGEVGGCEADHRRPAAFLDERPERRQEAIAEPLDRGAPMQVLAVGEDDLQTAVRYAAVDFQDVRAVASR